MFSHFSLGRRGMTLVELMVVVAIIGILSIVVLPLLASSSESRKTREAARSLTSYVARSQTRALGRTEWAGFWMVPVEGTNYALDLFAADVPEVFQGDTIPATVIGSATSYVVSSSTIPVFVLISVSGSIGGATVTGSVGDLVRFDATGPWYSLLTSSGTLLGLRSGSNALCPTNENANQTELNTPWPAANVPHTYELMRLPNRSGSPLTFADGRCVDMAWSGYGPPSDYTNNLLSATTVFGSGNPVAVLFDGTGRLRQLVGNGKRITPTSAVFLLVGRSDRVGNSVASPLDPNDDSAGTNWQYADSYWIGIDPLTGVTKVAECTKGAADVVASQANIRSELLATGR